MFLAVLSLALLGTITAVAVASLHVPNELKARALSIVSKEGKPVVTLASDPSSQGGAVTVLDQNGTRRGWLSAEPYGGELMIASADNDNRNTTASWSAWRQRAAVTPCNVKSQKYVSYESQDGGASAVSDGERLNALTPTSKIK